MSRGSLSVQAPLLMVPIRYTFSVIIYNTGVTPRWSMDAVRNALVAALPPGTGVGCVSCTDHGVYMLKPEEDR
jgi:hypothetical protein